MEEDIHIQWENCTECNNNDWWIIVDLGDKVMLECLSCHHKEWVLEKEQQ